MARAEYYVIWRQKHPNYSKKRKAKEKAKNEESFVFAKNHNTRWTKAEYRWLSANDSLSTEECAKYLGRTIRAVQNKRNYLKGGSYYAKADKGNSSGNI